MKKAFKKLTSFEFWQKFGKCLMVVIAVMPAAGLMVSIGNSLLLINANSAILATVGNVIAQIGWGIINNLHILFALAIGGSWAKERAGGAFAAGIEFILINLITGHVYGVSLDMIADSKSVVHNVLGGKMLVSDYFVNVLGQPALNMGVFVGIISGFVGATAPFLAPFLYGTLERLLLPFGLHHMITIPMNYTSLGGTYEILTGAQKGTEVFGQDPLWLAWVTDLINLKGSNPSDYHHLMATVTPARFKVGQMIGATGTLMGISLAMYRNVDPDKKKKYTAMFISTAAATFLTGVTEPIEYMFMFVAMPLYVVYALVQGVTFALADLVNLRLHSFGNIELLTRTPMVLKAGLGGDLINFVICCILSGVVMYFIADFMIKKFNFATPGRNGNYDDMDDDAAASTTGATVSANSQIVQIINLLGGRDNIEDVDACMTRLRVTVKDVARVGDKETWKKAGAMGLIIKGSGVQAVYGPKADILKSDIQDLLDSGAEIPTIDLAEVRGNNVTKVSYKGVTEDVLSIADGEVKPITAVKDPVFSAKMMGDGFAVEPENGNVYAPVSGIVTSVFPTKHAFGLLTDSGLEVLVHIGLDTVALNGVSFSVKVAEGQRVQAGDLLVVADLAAISSAGRETTIIVAFTNTAEIKAVNLTQTGKVSAKTPVAKVEL